MKAHHLRHLPHSIVPRAQRLKRERQTLLFYILLRGKLQLAHKTFVQIALADMELPGQLAGFQRLVQIQRDHLHHIGDKLPPGLQPRGALIPGLLKILQPQNIHAEIAQTPVNDALVALFCRADLSHNRMQHPCKFRILFFLNGQHMGLVDQMLHKKRLQMVRLHIEMDIQILVLIIVAVDRGHQGGRRENHQIPHRALVFGVIDYAVAATLGVIDKLNIIRRIIGLCVPVAVPEAHAADPERQKR